MHASTGRVTKSFDKWALLCSRIKTWEHAT